MSAQYFAQIDANNVVIHVAVVTAEFMAANPERYPGTWVETFIGVEGKTYAGIGYTYLDAADDFVAPRPFASWSLDANNDWQPPTPRPEGDFYWDEDSLSWVEYPAG
jgi:hypothetical protein